MLDLVKYLKHPFLRFLLALITISTIQMFVPLHDGRGKLLIWAGTLYCHCYYLFFYLTYFLLLHFVSKYTKYRIGSNDLIPNIIIWGLYFIFPIALTDMVDHGLFFEVLFIPFLSHLLILLVNRQWLKKSS